MTADFLIHNADLVATCAGPGPRVGAAQNDISGIERGSVAGFEGRIVFAGAADEGDLVINLTPGARR